LNRITALLRDPRVRRAREVLALSGEVLEDVWHAHEVGGKVAFGLAAVSAVAKVVEELVPAHSLIDYLRDLDYTKQSEDLHLLIADLLSSSPLPRRHEAYEDWNLVFFDDASTVLLYNEDYDSQYVEAYVRDPEVQRKVLADIVWSQGKDLALTASNRPSGRGKRTTPVSRSIIPLPPCPEYVGEPPTDYYVDRVKRHHEEDPNGTRGLLIVGPSGVGKGVLARQIARGVSPGGRVLQISSAMIGVIEIPNIVLIAELLVPSVLLLDDLELDGRASGEILALFEALRGKVRLVIGTVMSDDPDFHCEGIRPGRVDEIFYLHLPAEMIRRNLLVCNLGVVAEHAPVDDIVAATDGLSGAFIVEVALRVRRFGVESWREEVASVRRINGPEKPEAVADADDEDNDS
jgi:hypothetical protein